MEKENQMERLKQTYEEPCMSEEQLRQLKQTIRQAKQENRRDASRRKLWQRCSLAAAAVAAFVLLPNTSPTIAHAMEQVPLLGKLVEIVTIRDYQHEDSRNHASVKVPEILPEKDASVAEEVKETLENTLDEINEEISTISDEFIADFEANLEKELGYQNIGIDYEVINTTGDYFTLKLICYQVSGSGTQWNYYYTVDLTTGERLHLSELFAENADYITPISENIKKQMQDRMASDESVAYWLNHEIEEWNFKQITDQTAFYVNEKGNIVISFNEGDVAPMYMGVVSFEIPAEVIEDIKK